MLNIITLFTIDKIFETAKQKQVKLSAKSKMLYINFLTHHFKDKPPLVVNAHAFSIKKNSFKIEMFTNEIQQLTNAGLIEQRLEEIHFPNLWGMYIDRTKLKIQTQSDGENLNTINAFAQELRTSSKIKDYLMRALKLSEKHYQEFLEEFIAEQAFTEKEYFNEQSAKTHFTNWLKSKLKDLPEHRQTNRTQIPSSNKILGRDE